MSWLVTSIANSLKLDEEFGAQTATTATATATNIGENQPSQVENPNDEPDDQIPPRGVKNDLTEISKTLTRQFWGVASFLAPPPQISDGEQHSDDLDLDSSDPARITGIRSDLSEIGGKFRTGISRLSGNKAVSEFTKIASNLLHFGPDEDFSVDDYAKRGVIGVTEEVVAFARDIALHPKTWIDFPLPDDDDDQPDFELSDAQQEHALVIERLAPELAALRNELCLGYMSEACFWKIYFVLVHPILNRHDAEILSTPEIVRARAMLAQEFNKRGKPQPSESGTSTASSDTTKLSPEGHKSLSASDQLETIPVEVSAVERACSIEADIEMDKHPVTSTDIPVIDKRVVEEESIKQTKVEEATVSSAFKKVDLKDEDEDEDDADDWLKDENTEGEAVKGLSYSVGNDDDDISFSDLEDEEELPAGSKKHGNQTNKVSGEILKNKESNDWLDIEDIDA